MVPTDQPAGRDGAGAARSARADGRRVLSRGARVPRARQGNAAVRGDGLVAPLAYGIEAYWTASADASGWSAEPVPARAERSLSFEGGRRSRSATSSRAASDSVDGRWPTCCSRGWPCASPRSRSASNGEAFDRGALLIKREGNPDDLAANGWSRSRCVTACRSWIRAAPPRRPSRWSRPGWQHFQPLVAPRVGIWTGAPISPSSYGALWHLFDERLRVCASAASRSSASNQVDLSRYNVLDLPAGARRSRAYRAILGTEGVARAQAWIEAGGTAIGIGGGAEFLADEKSALTRAKLAAPGARSLPAGGAWPRRGPRGLRRQLPRGGSARRREKRGREAGRRHSRNRYTTWHPFSARVPRLSRRVSSRGLQPMESPWISVTG